jgi:hypothetical protein
MHDAIESHARDKSFPRPHLTRVGRPASLVLCILFSRFVALSIHIGALAVGIPHPGMPTPPDWARWLSRSGVFIALLIVLKLARPKVDRHGAVVMALVPIGIVAALNETLRMTFMNGYASKAYAFSFIGLSELLARNALITLL